MGGKFGGFEGAMTKSGSVALIWELKVNEAAEVLKDIFLSCVYKSQLHKIQKNVLFLILFTQFIILFVQSDEQKLLSCLQLVTQHVFCTNNYINTSYYRVYLKIHILFAEVIIVFTECSILFPVSVSCPQDLDLWTEISSGLQGPLITELSFCRSHRPSSASVIFKVTKAGHGSGSCSGSFSNLTCWLIVIETAGSFSYYDFTSVFMLRVFWTTNQQHHSWAWWAETPVSRENTSPNVHLALIYIKRSEIISWEPNLLSKNCPDFVFTERSCWFSHSLQYSFITAAPGGR